MGYAAVPSEDRCATRGRLSVWVSASRTAVRVAPPAWVFRGKGQCHSGAYFTDNLSHDLEVVKHMCNRIVVLYRGQVMESGPAASAFDNPGHPYTHALREAAPVPNPRLQRARHRAASSSSAPPVEKLAPGRSHCPFAPRCPYVEPRCWNERPLLQPS